MGVKFANALGACCDDYNMKGKDAKRLGAHEVLISKDEDGMKNTKIVSISFKYYSCRT
jgi:uncharacterized zinc-type alcohol dehydrogenase-like protein